MRNASAALHHALRMLIDQPENAWARDFVLQSTDNMAENISFLTRADSLRCAVTSRVVRVNLTNHRGPIPPSTQYPSEQLIQDNPSVAAISLLLPVWTSNNVTVGLTLVGIVNTQDSLQPSPSSLQRLRFGRFARDERTAETFQIASMCNPKSPRHQVEIMHFENISTTTRRDYYACCESSLFFSGQVDESILHARDYIQLRDCPLCFQHPLRCCRCTFKPRLPLSPADFSAFLLNSTFIAGTFNRNMVFNTSTSSIGPCSPATTRWATSKFQSVLREKSVYDCVPSREWWIPALNREIPLLAQKSAVQLCLMHCRPSAQFLPPPVEDGTTAHCTPMENHANSSSSPQAHAQATASLEHKAISFPAESPLSHASKAMKKRVCSQEAVWHDVGGNCTPSLVPFHNGPERTVVYQPLGGTRPMITTLPTVVPIGTSELCGRIDTEPAMSKVFSRPYPRREKVGSKESGVAHPTSTAVRNSQSQDFSPEITNVVDQAEQCPKLPETSDVGMRTRDLAPVKPPLAWIQRCMPDETQFDHFSTEIEKINDPKLRRILKNRAAASRSNARRREHIRSIRCSLEIAQGKMEDLEAKLRQLQFENRELKERVVAAWRAGKIQDTVDMIEPY